MVWPRGGGPVCHSSEVERGNVTTNGNLIMKEMHVSKYISVLLGEKFKSPKCKKVHHASLHLEISFEFYKVGPQFSSHRT